MFHSSAAPSKCPLLSFLGTHRDMATVPDSRHEDTTPAHEPQPQTPQRIPPPIPSPRGPKPQNPETGPWQQRCTGSGRSAGQVGANCGGANGAKYVAWSLRQRTDGWRLAVGSGWQLAVDGWWRVAVGGWWSLGAVFNKKKIEVLKDSPERRPKRSQSRWTNGVGSEGAGSYRVGHGTQPVPPNFRCHHSEQN